MYRLILKEEKPDLTKRSGILIIAGREKQSKRRRIMRGCKMKSNCDQYFGFVLLVLYVLMTYFGSVQKKDSAYFEDYISSKAAHIEGSGAVFGYIMSAPVVETILAVLLSVFLVGLFFFTREIILKSNSIIGKRIIMCLIIVLCFGGVGMAVMNILEYGQWNFTILMMAELSFLLYLLYFLFYISLSPKHAS